MDSRAVSTVSLTFDTGREQVIPRRKVCVCNERILRYGFICPTIVLKAEIILQTIVSYWCNRGKFNLDIRCIF